MKFGILTLTLAAASSLIAQDPPSRVARLDYLNGPVSFQPATVDDWSAATLNYPLTTGDHLYADQGASAEVGIGPNFIRIAHQTNFGFLNLDDRTVQIRLTEGSINIRVRALDDQDVWEVDTPNGAITLLRSGEYRIDTNANRNLTMVTGRGGDAEITANGQSFPVHARQTGSFTGDGQQQGVQEANAPDDFDRFASDRDRLENQAPPQQQFVSQNMVGAEDLGQYGTWQAQSEYGPIWRPRVAAGWAPYHDGRWVWREPWGWTWVDEAPWGFAPFHYGRWAFVDGGWGWCPGAVVARPVYAPALVAFVGGGVSLSVGFGGGGGGVGWFPLGPREIYAPSYHVSPGYVRQVNITNVREINNVTINNIVVNRTVNNVYVNRNVPGAVTAVNRQDFVSARSVRTAPRLDAAQFRSAPVAGFTPGYAPQRESVFGRAAGNVARPQEAVFGRQVIARTPPPAAQVSFAARQQALQNNGGRPLAPEQLNSIRSSQPAPARPAFRSSNAPNEGFGRNPAPQLTPQAAPPRDMNRPQDRFQGRPSQAAPAPTAPPAENRGFGRAPEQQVPPRAPQAEPRPAENRPTPPAAPAENRGFGRTPAPQVREQPAPQRAPRPEPSPAAPPRVEPRPEPRAERPAPAPAQENRGFGRQPAPAATPAEKPKPEKPKEEKKPGEKEKK